MSVLDLNDVDTLVLCGGGVHGIAYLGALETLYLKHGLEVFPLGPRNPRITTVCGVSVGALIGLLIALGFDSYAETHALMHTILRSLVEDVHLVSFARDWGGNNGQGIRSMLRARAAKRIGLSRPTFAQLRAKTGVRLRVSATDLCTCATVCYSPDETPDADVVDAVYGSMAVPPLFAPSRISHSRLLVDGGLMRNVPRLPADTPPERVLVLRAVEDGGGSREEEEEMSRNEGGGVDRVLDYVSRIVRCAFLARVRDDLGWLKERGLAGQTISVDCNGVSSAFSFGLDDRTKKSLLLVGLEAAEAFLATKAKVVACSKSRSVGTQTV